MDQSEKYRLDKRAVQVKKLSDPDGWAEYWHSKTPAERLDAAESIRQTIYGYDPATTRLQRVLRVTKRPRR